ncbi:MAG: glycosyltransferase family 9 protein [Planctomycetes bacterium]|nr:glycosyltransferase family 9 protein [Planctomycetota bacterium]
MALPRRILIIRLGALGDIVHTLSVLRPLHDRIPDAYIAWMVEDTWADLLRGHPLIDGIITIPKRRWRSGFLRPWQWLETMGDVLAKRRDIVARRFDLTIDFQGNLKSGSIAVWCGARERLGYAYSNSRELNPIFMTQRAMVEDGTIHRSEKALRLVREVVGECAYSPPDLPTSMADRAFAEGVMVGVGKRPVVAIHPATSSFGALKRWPIASYAAVGDVLTREDGAAILITWGPGEEELAKELSKTMEEPAVVSVETKRLGQLVALLRECDLFIGADTGPLHIASAAGTPVVALFGPKDPAIYGPRGPAGARVVQADVPCRPCTKRKCPDPICMTELSPEAVLAAARELLPG